MKVILLEKVPNLGGLGDVAKVRPGYARNYLFPQGKAERATPMAVADFEKRRGELEKRQAERQQNLQNARDAVDGMLLQIPARASADGSLYGSITATVIAQALNQEKIADVEVRRGQIIIPAGNLKEIGDHEVGVTLSHGMHARITVSVVSDDSTNDDAAITETANADNAAGEKQ